MELATVKLFRTKCESAQYTLYNKDKNCDPADATKTVHMPIHIVCDNSLNVVYNPDHPTVIWDDSNECFYAFVYNTESTIHGGNPAMSFGNKPFTPGVCICVDYGEIQNIRVILNEEAFEKFSAAVNMPAAQKEYIHNMLFVETDMKTRIDKARNTSYITMTDKRKDPATRRYQDIHEYNKTVHPMAF